MLLIQDAIGCRLFCKQVLCWYKTCNRSVCAFNQYVMTVSLADSDAQDDIADMDGETMMQSLGYEPHGTKVSQRKRTADSSAAEPSKSRRK